MLSALYLKVLLCEYFTTGVFIAREINEDSAGPAQKERVLNPLGI